MVAQVLAESEKVALGSPRQIEYGAERAFRCGQSALPSANDGLSRSGLGEAVRDVHPARPAHAFELSQAHARGALLDALRECDRMDDVVGRKDSRKRISRAAAARHGRR